MKIYNFLMCGSEYYQSEDHKIFIEALCKNHTKWLEILEKERKRGNTYVLKNYPE